MKIIKQHKDQNEDEIYLGEYTIYNYEESVGWLTKRLGNVSQYNIFPVFVKAQEVIDAGLIDSFNDQIIIDDDNDQ